jgi:hypothetical protein
MKRIVLLLLAILALSGCTQVVKTETIAKPEGKAIWVYDVYWNLIMQSTAASKEIQVYESGDIESRVEEYKLANPTIGVFVEDEETPIEEAPEAVVYIVNPTTHDLIKVLAGVPREMFVANAAQFELDCRAVGGVMYIDVVPPPPLPVDDTYKHYIYLIAKDGTVLFSTQTTEELFTYTLNAYYAEVYSYPGSYVVHGQLYQL